MHEKYEKKSQWKYENESRGGLPMCYVSLSLTWKCDSSKQMLGESFQLERNFYFEENTFHQLWYKL